MQFPRLLACEALRIDTFFCVAADTNITCPAIQISHKEPLEGAPEYWKPSHGTIAEEAGQESNKFRVPLNGSFEKLWAPFMYPLLSSYQMRRDFQAKPLIIENPHMELCQTPSTSKDRKQCVPPIWEFPKIKGPFYIPPTILITSLNNGPPIIVRPWWKRSVMQFPRLLACEALRVDTFCCVAADTNIT